MARISANLELTLPEGSDKVEIDVLSNDLEKIDTEFGRTLNEDQIANNLNTTEAGKVLDARQGAALKTSIDTLGTNKLSKTDIVNDLTTGGTDKALSAEQGKVLSQKIDGKHIMVAGTIPASSWSGSGSHRYKAVTVQGIRANDLIVIDLDLSSASSGQAQMCEDWQKIQRVQLGNDKITVHNYEGAVPVADVNFQIIILR